MFDTLSQPPEDALHGVMARFAKDPRYDKIDLGVGVYRDETGASPLMAAVAEAEAAHIVEQTSKSYLGLCGDERFLDAMTRLLLKGAKSDRIAVIQTVGGTGGVWLALACAKLANPETTVHIGLPTWPNHLSICAQLGLSVKTFDYFDKTRQSVLFDEMHAVASKAESGDILILHGPCHNPTGADLSAGQIAEILQTCQERGVAPLVDAAYYGLGGDIDDDLAGIRRWLESFPEAFVVLSCSKSFSLYRERTGVLFAAAENAKLAAMLQGHLELIARGTYSMPPAHGAAAVARVLSEPALEQQWRIELGAMRARIISVRAELAEVGADLPALSFIAGQKGIFSLLPINETTVGRLSSEHGVYMAQSGRINVAGFKDGDPKRFVEALRKVLVT